MSTNAWVEALSSQSNASNKKSELNKYKSLVSDFIESLKCIPKKDDRQKEDAQKTIKYFESLMMVHGIEYDAR